MRLLVVEDEPAIASAVSRLLKRWGHVPLTAGSLAEARRMAAEHAPEALLSDMKLPDGRGLDFAIALGVPFMLMSGYASFDEAVEALRAGCVDFLTKPVAMKDLQTALLRLADRMSHWDLAVIEASEAALRVLRPAPDSIRASHFESTVIDWHDAAQARARFESLSEAEFSEAERQIVAELLQASQHGRLVLNRGETWLRVWLQAELDWDAAEAARDRRTLIEGLAERAIFRANGVVVECGSHA